jgi:hypothetical protein
MHLGELHSQRAQRNSNGCSVNHPGHLYKSAAYAIYRNKHYSFLNYQEIFYGIDVVRSTVLAAKVKVASILPRSYAALWKIEQKFSFITQLKFSKLLRYTFTKIVLYLDTVTFLLL